MKEEAPCNSCNGPPQAESLTCIIIFTSVTRLYVSIAFRSRFTETQHLETNYKMQGVTNNRDKFLIQHVFLLDIMNMKRNINTI